MYTLYIKKLLIDCCYDPPTPIPSYKKRNTVKVEKTLYVLPMSWRIF